MVTNLFFTFNNLNFANSMKKLLVLTGCLVIVVLNMKAQINFQTVAESSDFKSTSNYEDVISNINQLKKSPFLRYEAIARSTEGRDIPFLIIGNPLPRSPKDMEGDKRIVVYIQANIHAGEVEGKEATLMFVRDLLNEKNQEILKNIVLLVCPLFNADGNQKISPLERTYQNGPVNGVGVRYNGQMLDLNRDAMKTESPEVKGVITNVFDKWDPSIFMDCHTTDGSFHVEPVTFTWMVNPAGESSLISYLRDKMMPAMSATLLNKYKVENCFYGEFNSMTEPEKGWYFDSSEPRYMTNYVGLRNRIGILNENYVYASYKSRVLGCYNLIKSLMDYCTQNKDEIKNLVKEADRKTVSRGMNPVISDSFPVAYNVRPLPQKVTIQTYLAETYTEPNGRRNYRRTDKQVNVTVPYYIDYYPVKSVRFPYAYIIDAPDPQVLELLRIHGIILERLTEKTKIEVEGFKIMELKGASRLNQGHYNNTIKGVPLKDTIEFKTGTYIVRTSQPLANLAAYLLEPQSNDGLVTWNFLDRYLVPQWGPGYNPYPVYKVLDPVRIKSKIEDLQK
jgi:murein tripeptide amidase MpaA